MLDWQGLDGLRIMQILMMRRKEDVERAKGLFKVLSDNFKP